MNCYNTSVLSMIDDVLAWNLPDSCLNNAFQGCIAGRLPD